MWRVVKHFRFSMAELLTGSALLSVSCAALVNANYEVAVLANGFLFLFALAAVAVLSTWKPDSRAFCISFLAAAALHQVCLHVGRLAHTLRRGSPISDHACARQAVGGHSHKARTDSCSVRCRRETCFCCRTRIASFRQRRRLSSFVVVRDWDWISRPSPSQGRS